jgi:ATP-dependent RNA helicase RhlE
LRALVLVPTRELCVQVAESLRAYASGTELAVCTAFGGIDIGIQEAAFKRGLDVLVACPGRMIDHLERRNVSFENLQTVVLDEADRMLDMGFLPQIRSIMVRCPHQRRTWLFSATMPAEVDGLCRAFLPDAERIQVGSRSQAPRTISHRFIGVNAADKQRFLAELLRRESGRVLVFVKTKIRADQLGRALARAGLPADSIHGDKTAEARHVVLRSFDGGRTRFLVATDVAARGIDVDDIALVVNYEMPNEVEDYVHRVGRTGRAGAQGRALSLVAPTERRIHKGIVAHLRRTGAPDGAEPAPATGGGEPPRSSDTGRRRRSRGKRLAPALTAVDPAYCRRLK